MPTSIHNATLQLLPPPSDKEQGAQHYSCNRAACSHTSPKRSRSQFKLLLLQLKLKFLLLLLLLLLLLKLKLKLKFLLL
jgi:hypothetical protein